METATRSRARRAGADSKPLAIEPQVDHLPAIAQQPVYQAPAPVTPMDMIAAASARGASPEELGKLMDLFDRQQSREAERAFLMSFTAFKRNPPEIIKRLGADFTTEKGRTSYSYADLAIVCEAIISSLAEHGLTHAWSYAQNGTQVSVTCTLTHELGHHRKATLSANDDRTGSKNAIQATGSAVHYLERYTLLGVSGLATRDGTDNDGADAGEPLDQNAVRDAVASSRARAKKPADVAAARTSSKSIPGEELLSRARAAADQGNGVFAKFWREIQQNERGALVSEMPDFEARIKKSRA